MVVVGNDFGVFEVGGLFVDFEFGYLVVVIDFVNLQYMLGMMGFLKGCMLMQDYWLLFLYVIGEVYKGFGSMRFFFWVLFFYMDGQWLYFLVMVIGGMVIVVLLMSLLSFFDWLYEYEVYYCVLLELILKMVVLLFKDVEILFKFVYIFGWCFVVCVEVEECF